METPNHALLPFPPILHYCVQSPSRWGDNPLLTCISFPSLPSSEVTPLIQLGVWGALLSMTHSLTTRLSTEYAKNHCNQTIIVQVIIENVVICFFLRERV